MTDRWAGGPEPRLSTAQKKELSRVVKAGPDPDKDGVVRWRCLDLKKVIRDCFGVDYHERTVGKILKEPGFSHVSVRPQHPGQDPAVIEDFPPYPGVSGSLSAAGNACRYLVPVGFFP